jgi:2,4-dienoyl-CoA reductase-like NADH-dependent reductase (Old Yellow Enzyme family)
LEQFFSPKTNLRTDRYGGSLENRMRIQLEIVRGIREKCGQDFVIGFALVAADYVPGGIVLEELKLEMRNIYYRLMAKKKLGSLAKKVILKILI